jgi:hypothetical protein
MILLRGAAETFPNEFTGLYPMVNAPPELDGARNGADMLPTPEEFFRSTC